MNPDAIEQAILVEFEHLTEIWSRIEISDTQCTRDIKDRVGAIGSSLGYKVYCSSCAFSENGEWLFDLAWTEETDTALLGLPLALESEWDRNGLSDDFGKLLVSKADHRVMVLWESTQKECKNRIDELITEIKESRMSMLGDRYLFLDWIKSEERFDSLLYIVK